MISRRELGSHVSGIQRARVRVQIVTFSTLALFELRQSFHVHEIDPTDDDKRESHKVSNLQKQQNESSSIKKVREKIKI